MKHIKKITVLTGAGISAESGIKTFRDADGLWEGHHIMEVASMQGWENNPQRVLDFYNKRRAQLLEVKPNAAHYALADLEEKFDVTIITQNVDNLHERSGSTHIIHLHGELLKVRSTFNDGLIYPWKEALHLGDLCEYSHQLRPHIVWFGEAVPLFEDALKIMQKTDILLLIGTSMQVYPAASLVDGITSDTPLYFVDPKPNITDREFPHLKVIPKKATIGVPQVVCQLIDMYG